MLTEDQHPCYYHAAVDLASCMDMFECQEASHAPTRRDVMQNNSWEAETLIKFFSTKLVEVRGLKVDRMVYMFLGLCFRKMPVE